MQELKRILVDRRFLLALLAVFFLNGMLLYRDMKPDEESVAYSIQQYGQNYKKDLEKITNELKDKYEKMDTKKAKEELSLLCIRFNEEEEQLWSNMLKEWNGTGEFPDYSSIYLMFTEEERQYRAAVRRLDTAYEYIIGYQNDIKQILERADKQIKNNNVFVENSFSGRNIQKTKVDFEKILEIEPAYGNQEAFKTLCNYNLSDFIMLFVVMAAIIVVLDERKKGLWEFTYSMPAGRKRLSLMRIGVMGAVSFSTAALVYGENILLAGIYQGGYGDITRPIQSMEICEKVILKVSVMQYMLLVFFWKFFILFLIGVLLLFFVLTMKSYMQVFFVFTALMSWEYIVYLTIDSHDRFAILKYVNILAWMDSEWCMSNYLNLNFFGYPIGLYQMMCIVSGLLFIIVSLLMFFSGEIHPFIIKESKLEKIFAKLTAQLKLYRHGSMLLTELYKQFFIQRMWIVVLLVFLISWYRYDNTKVHYDYKGTLYNTYMEVLEGEVTQNKLNYLQNEITLWQEQRKEQEQLLTLGADLTYETQASIEGKIKQFKTAEECTEELAIEAERLLEKKRDGAAVQFVNHTGYNYYIGEGSEKRNKTDELLMLAMAVLMASVLFVSENAQNFRLFIHTTKRGRAKFRICKYVVLLIEEMCIFVPIAFSSYLTICVKYGMKQGEASAFSLSFLDGFFMDINIRAVVVLYLILMFGLLYLVMLFITVISEQMKNVMASMVVCMAIAVLPAAFYYIGFTYISFFTVLDELIVSAWLF